MPHISLKYYLEQVDTMIRDGSYDEAVFHCHHILQHYPKNIAAYRSLSAALLASNHWPEAGDALTRILSVIPDDVLAHYGLSQVYRRLRDPEKAIWHLERAYEQEPTNEKFIHDLRDLYFDQRGVSNARLQLTTGAVVQQYARNSLYEQAVDALVNSLDRMPERVDLRLMLARIQQKAGSEFEAAEVALDVLETLPDCLEANVMVARLWLNAQRPSDAQRFLSRIESVDPYLAISIASGAVAPEDMFDLPEADYKTAARRQITEARPDWLSDIDESGEFEFDVEDAVHAAAASAVMPRAPEQTVDDVSVSENESDSFENAFEEAFDESYRETDTDWLQELVNSSSVIDELPADSPANSSFGSSRTGMTGLLSALQGEDKPEAMPETEEEDFREEAEEIQSFDSLFDETDDVADSVDDTGDVDEEGEADALAWLEEDHSVSEERPVAPTDAISSSDDVDPLAWMRDSGVELSEEPRASGYNPYALDEDNSELQDPESVDTLAWLKSSGIELVEDDELPADFDDSMDQVDEDRNPLAWLEESGIEAYEEEDHLDAAQDMDAEPLRGTNPLNWLEDDSLLDEMLSMEELTGDTALFDKDNRPSALDAEPDYEQAFDEADLSMTDFSDDDLLADNEVVLDEDKEASAFDDEPYLTANTSELDTLRTDEDADLDLDTSTSWTFDDDFGAFETDEDAVDPLSRLEDDTEDDTL